MSEQKNKPIRVYSGAEPYAFISYAHADADRVLPVIGALDRDRFRLWYDAGIEAGTNWPEVVATHLLHAGAVVFFLSARFLRSQNCIREVHYAVAERKPMVCVYLEPVELPGDLAMQFSTASVIHGESHVPEIAAAEAEAALGAAFLGDGVTGYEAVRAVRRRGNGWRVVSLVFASLFLLTVLAVVGYFNDWFPSLGARTVTVETTADGGVESGPVEITTFKDSFSRDILLRAYGGVSLYLCGNVMVSDPSAIRYESGAWSVAGTPVEAGRPDVLALVAEKEDLAHLALVDQGIESFGALSSLTQLAYLDISGNPVSDLTFLQALPALTTLKLIDVAASDYAVLGSMPALQTVYVDETSLDAVLDALEGTAVDVVVKR